MKSYDITELVDFREQPDGSVSIEPKPAIPVEPKCLRDIGFNMQCQEPQGHYGPCRWHRPTAFG